MDCIVIDSSQDSLWHIFGIQDLDERMLVIESLFAYFTVVKVLTDAALVSDTEDGADSASITSNIQMLCEVGAWCSLQGLAKFLALHQLLKDLSCLSV